MKNTDKFIHFVDDNILDYNKPGWLQNTDRVGFPENISQNGFPENITQDSFPET